MKLSNLLNTGLFIVLLCGGPAVATAQTANETSSAPFAIQRGYRTGYSDGYMAGYRDSIDRIARNYSRHAEYGKADRAYSKDYGTIAEYRDGYQQGFEAGYDTGFDRRSFEATLPASLAKRGVVVGDNKELVAQTAPIRTSSTTEPVRINNEEQPTSPQDEPDSAHQNYQGATIIIPKETELLLELDSDLSTQQSREGDKFAARVVGPSEIAGAMVEGRISKVKSPGRIKRRSEMVLSFDRIVLTDNRWSNFAAVLTEVMPVKGDNVKRVDNEGTAIGQSSLKGDAIKVGGATGAGAIAGAIIGGPVGAAVGAGVGAAFGVGAIVIERGKHIRLNRNQQLRIRTSYDTQIR
ncbi:MAG: hypothetical protein IPM59_13840 [Chloracidobacterium sp.]|nr:hypothetical protein [Chloracidobacterium sp.]